MSAEERFLEIYDKYSPQIMRYVYWRVSDKEVAQDLTQEVFLKSWQYITSGKEIRINKAFVYKVANNLIIDHYRQKNYRKTVSLEAMKPAEIRGEIDVDSPQEEVEKSILINQARNLINQLDEQGREIIYYRYVDDLSVREIGYITGKTSGHIRVIIHRALKTLRENYVRKL